MGQLTKEEPELRPAPFTLHRPLSLEDASLLAQKGALPLAGGQALLQDLRQRNCTPSDIINLGQIADLSEEITIRENYVHIGAKATVKNLIDDNTVSEYMPWLNQASQKLGDVQIRNFATVVGNVCWSDPRANLAIALLASQAKILIFESSGDIARLNLKEFFTGFRKNVLRNRIAIALEVPLLSKLKGIYLEFSRQPQDLALVNMAAVREKHSQSINLIVGGILERPIQVESKLDDPFEKIAECIRSSGVNRLQDQFASYDHKISILSALTDTAKETLKVI
mgnify:CR=1 FL=1